jgi:hypothetical protein
VGAGLAACNESTSALDDDERIGPVVAASMTPDPVALGDGGWAFGSGSMSRAATVANGVLYQANMDYMAIESIGDQKDAWSGCWSWRFDDADGGRPERMARSETRHVRRYPRRD